MAKRPHGLYSKIFRTLYPCFCLQEYSGSQLKALLSFGFGTRNNRKAKQRLLQIIDDMDKRK